MRIELVRKLPPFLCSATKRAEAEDCSAIGSNHITIANSNRGTHSLVCNIKSGKDTNIVKQECCRNVDFHQDGKSGPKSGKGCAWQGLLEHQRQLKCQKMLWHTCLTERFVSIRVTIFNLFKASAIRWGSTMTACYQTSQGSPWGSHQKSKRPESAWLE